MTAQTPKKNLQRRIKRHITAPAHECFAATLPGFEAICEKELSRLPGLEGPLETVPGGIIFRARIFQIMMANLHLKSALRILVRISRFTASSFHQLEKKIAAIGWDLYLPGGCIPSIKVTSHHSRLYHSQAVAQRISQGIDTYWKFAQIGAGQAHGQTVFARLDNDMLTLSIDSSGDSLYKRGIKTHMARAPLRETTAAAILMLCGYRGQRPLVDPMCGAGTFALEAAMIAKNMAPGRLRTFAFMQWPAFRLRQWRHVLNLADNAVATLDTPLIYAIDKSLQACDALNRCIDQHHLADAVSVHCHDFFDIGKLSLDLPPGLIVLNPPYGHRLHPKTRLDVFYQRIGQTLKTFFKGWRAGVLVPKRSLINALPIQGSLKNIDHGGLNLHLLSGKIK
ncbi:MAG: RNA methyltransferase [Desulfobacteraceae bacterium]|nr:RNA methyltransferase [Desulfobacteraceae bacterium]